MFYVYILESNDYDQFYVGYTTDLKSRLRDHNSGKSKHTSKFKPWHMVTYIGFNQEAKAIAFEKYLKTGSGIAFARKHLH